MTVLLHINVTEKKREGKESVALALGEGARIVAPDTVVEQVREEIRRLEGQYGEKDIF